ncbi:MAG: CdaR family protein [candidate division WOR-3 bacterium]|jgi:YbbR domain-containing protein
MLRSILRFITRDPARKIFAIIFAIGLWIYVAIGNNYSYRREIQVIYTNLSDSFMIVDSVSRIDVTFHGRGGALFSIWAAPPKAQCDLKEKTPGTTTLSTEALRIPVGYGPLRIDYNTPAFDITIDNKIQKRVEVAVPVKDALKKGYAINRVSALDTVTVVGPQRTLRNINEIATETLSVRNRSRSFEKELRLEIPSALLNLNRKSVNVAVDIAEATQKTLTFVPLVLIYSPTQSVRVNKSYLDTLTVTGTREKIDELELDDIEVKINLTKLEPGDYELPAEVVLPKHITPTYSVPRKFTINVN